MVDRSKTPDILKRLPRNRIPPFQEIDWENEFYLRGFMRILESEETNIKKSRLGRLWLRCLDLRCIFIDIGLIVPRINEDCGKFNRREELFELASRQGRMWTDEEENEYETHENHEMPRDPSQASESTPTQICGLSRPLRKERSISSCSEKCFARKAC